jgi:hypothetical protein
MESIAVEMQNRSVDVEEHDVRMYTFMLTNPKVIFFQCLKSKISHDVCGAYF